MFDTFHTSGTGNKTVSTGIPRLKELINAAKHLKTPGMLVHLESQFAQSKNIAERICAQLQHTILAQVVLSAEVVCDADYKNSAIEEDRPWMDIQNAIPDENAPEATDLEPFLLRLVFSRDALYRCDRSLNQIQDIREEVFDDEFYIMPSDDNNGELVMHIRMYNDEEERIPATEQEEDGVHEGENEQRRPKTMEGERFLNEIKVDLLQSITVCGVPGIDRTFVSQKQKPKVDENGVLNTKEKEYVIETDGINMRDTIYVPGVDPARLIATIRTK